MERKEFIAFYVTQDEKLAIVQAAKDADQTISEYCRTTLAKQNSKIKKALEGETDD